MICKQTKIRLVLLAAFLIATALMLSGCSTFGANKQAGADASMQKNPEKMPLYYDFGDVLLPSELKLDRDASFVFQTPTMTSGVLALKGRVDSSSLITFFETNMTKDNWTPISSFKSIRTIMLYQKEGRWCVISISEKEFFTYVEVWVAPTTTAATTGGLMKQ